MVDGSIIFTPSDTLGKASFTYTVQDALGNQDTAVASVYVARPPVLLPETITGSVDEAGVITIDQADLLANDYDIYTENNSGLNVTEVHGAVGGAVVLDTSGQTPQILFTPDGSEGQGTFDYVVTDNAGGKSTATATVNRPPEAVNDTLVSTMDAGATFAIDVATLIANDSDPDLSSSSTLNLVSVSNAIGLTFA